MRAKEPSSDKSLLASPRVRAAIVVGLALFFTQLALLILRSRWQNGYAAELARIQAAGEPVTVEDLYEFYSPSSEALTAGEEWMAACEFLGTDDYKGAAKGVLFVDPGVLDEAEDSWELGGQLPYRAAAEKFLKKYDPQFQRLYSVIERNDTIEFSPNWGGDYEGFHERYDDFRSVCRLLHLHAAFDINKGDANSANRDVFLLLKLSDAFRREPIWWTQNKCAYADAVASQLTSRMIADELFSPETLARLQQSFSNREYLHGMRDALVADRAECIRTVGRLGARQGISEYLNKRFGGSDFPQWVDPVWLVAKPADSTALAAHLTDVIEALDLPTDRAVAQITSLEDALQSKMTKDAWTQVSHLAAYMLSMPANDVIYAYQYIAAARTTAAGCAAARWRLAEGDWPKSLEHLAERYPDLDHVDPFTNQPLLYRVDDDGVVIYSVGPDGIDDGGRRISDGGDSRNAAFRIIPNPWIRQATRRD